MLRFTIPSEDLDLQQKSPLFSGMRVLLLCALVMLSLLLFHNILSLTWSRGKICIGDRRWPAGGCKSERPRSVDLDGSNSARQHSRAGPTYTHAIQIGVSSVFRGGEKSEQRLSDKLIRASKSFREKK